MRYFVLNEAGEPVPEQDLNAWGSWFQTANRTVAYDEVGPMRVSTVFLAIDHSFSSAGGPVLYETMIFGGANWAGEYQVRYRTKAEALVGHAMAVAEAKARLN